MGKLRIESIARALGKDPKTLSSLELRKLCILIDWIMALETYQPNNISATPLLSDSHSFSDERVANLSAQLVSAIQIDGFLELDQLKPDTELMDHMFQRLGSQFGYEQEVIDNILNNTGFISDYENQLDTFGLVYTDYLEYKKQLTIEELNVFENFFFNLSQMHPWLAKQKIAIYDANTCAIEINPNLTIPQNLNVTDNAMFILMLLKTLASIEKEYRYKTSQSSLHFLNNRLKDLLPLIENEITQTLILKNIENAFISLIKLSRNWNISSDLCAQLAQLITQAPILRGWKTLKQCNQSQPIHRVILMGYEDITDEEVTLTVNVMLNNHPKENIAITYTPNDVISANQWNQRFGNYPFTLQVIGHGTQKQNGEFTANLGSFRGNATVTGFQVARLINSCPNIHHVRLSCCFSGQVRQQQMAITPMFEKRHFQNPIALESRKTFTIVNNGLLTEDNSPFAMNTAAVSCWNSLSKGRPMSMTVSPAIIEPDEALNLMLWKPSLDDVAIGAKEIRVTTENGPKFLPAWQRHSQHVDFTDATATSEEYYSLRRKHH